MTDPVNVIGPVVPEGVYAALKSKKDDTAPAGEPAPAPAGNGGNPASAFDDSLANEWIKTKSGGKYDSFDAMFAATSVQPQTIEKTVEKIVEKEPQFPNENSKQLFEAIVNEKYEEVLPFVQANVIAKNVDKLQPDDVIKAHLKAQFGLTEEQTNYEFNKLFVPTFDDSVEPMEKEIQTKKATVRKAGALTEAQSFFKTKAQEAKLPFSAAPSPAATGGAPAAVPQFTESERTVFDFGSEAGKKGTPSKIPFEFNIPELNLGGKGDYELPQDRVSQIKEQIKQSPDKALLGYIASKFYTPDQQVNIDALAADIAFNENPGAMVSDIAKSTAMQTFKQRLQSEHRPGKTDVPAGNFISTEDDKAKSDLYRAARIPQRKAVQAGAPQG